MNLETLDVIRKALRQRYDTFALSAHVATTGECYIRPRCVRCRCSFDVGLTDIGSGPQVGSDMDTVIDRVDYAVNSHRVSCGEVNEMAVDALVRNHIGEVKNTSNEEYAERMMLGYAHVLERLRNEAKERANQ